jgi:hypothetical protein
MTDRIQYPKPNKTYRHYKGGLYKVITLAKHSETNEDMVVYQSLLFGDIRVRPLSMWFERVPIQLGSNVTSYGERFTEE